MRVLMVAQFYPPIVGGEEHAVEALSIELAQRGHRVAVATIQHPGLAEREEVDGVRVHRLRSVASTLPFLYTGARLHAPPAPDPALAWQLRRVLDVERP
ncbi:MAG TPA: glycosyltransferase, partial [Vicinamibacterales bacterium]|nr:glycosyltransferase [Vicinamibacterales bacterium]